MATGGKQGAKKGGKSAAKSTSTAKRKAAPLPTNSKSKKAAPSVSKGAAVAQGLRNVTEKEAEEIKVKIEALSTNKNFTAEEDEFICRAYVSATTDPVKGASQKGASFWKTVHEKFYLLYDDEAALQVPVNTRWKWESVRDRFQKTLAKDITKFNEFYKATKEKNPSGMTEANIIEAAMESYRFVCGKPFKHSDTIVRILQKVPKFNPMIDGYNSNEEDGVENFPTSTDEDKDTTNVVGSAMGMKEDRPVGTKKAKKSKLLEKFEQESNASQSHITAVQDVAASSRAMAATMAKRQRHDSWAKRAELFLKMGDMNRAEQMLQKMEDDDANDALPPPQNNVPSEITTNDNSNVEDFQDQDHIAAAMAVPGVTMQGQGNDEDGDDNDDEESDHPSQPSNDSRMMLEVENQFEA